MKFLLSLLGAGIGAGVPVIIGLRIIVARLEERMKAANDKLTAHDKRLDRIEGLFIKAD
jgi:hypothetical protein